MGRVLWGIVVFGVAIGLWLASGGAVQAETCRTVAGHSICIVSIKRSAKNYWEYRAAVRVDGIERPIELYNCRDRIRIRADKTIVPFHPAGAGPVICRYFRK